jgi:uncharacterized protein (DUF58 family)
VPRFRPTAAGWFALIGAAASLGVALTNPGLPTSLFASCLWGVLFASSIMAFLSVRKLSLHTATRELGTAGHPVSLPITVHNRSVLHRQPLLVIEDCVFVESGRVVTQVPCLAPRECCVLPRDPLALRRGFHQLKRIHLVGSDPLGLFYRSRAFDIPREILILPESVPLSHLELNERQRIAVDNGRPIGVSGRGRDFYGIREYRPTDGMRMIHWRATARHGKHMVREFQENSITHITIVLDGERALLSPDGENFEMLIRGVASLLMHLAGSYCQITLVCGLRESGRVVHGDAASAARELMPFLATLDSHDIPLADILDEALEAVPPEGLLYLFALSPLDTAAELLEIVSHREIELRSLCAPAAQFAKSADSTANLATPGTLLVPGCDLAAALEGA